MSIQKIGLIVGKFYPLHQGHINMILSAKLAVDQLHVFVCSDTQRDQELYLESAFTKAPTSSDRVNWAKDLLTGIPGITVHDFNEDGIPAYPNGWQAWSDRLKETLTERQIKPTIIFSSELQDKDFYEAYFQTKVTLVDPPRDKFPVSATKIRNNPFQYWTFIPTIIRPFFTRTILIERDFSKDPSLLPSILKLFNAVEVTGFEKISFKVISQQEMPLILTEYQQDARQISAMIGRDAFIQASQQLSEKMMPSPLQKCQMLPVTPYDEEQHEVARTLQERNTFNDISSFINRLMMDNVP